MVLCAVFRADGRRTRPAVSQASGRAASRKTHSACGTVQILVRGRVWRRGGRGVHCGWQVALGSWDMETHRERDGKSKGPGCVTSDTRGLVGLRDLRRMQSLLSRT